MRLSARLLKHDIVLFAKKSLSSQMRFHSQSGSSLHAHTTGTDRGLAQKRSLSFLPACIPFWQTPKLQRHTRVTASPCLPNCRLATKAQPTSPNNPTLRFSYGGQYHRRSCFINSPDSSCALLVKPCDPLTASRRLWVATGHFNIGLRVQLELQHGIGSPAPAGNSTRSSLEPAHPPSA